MESQLGLIVDANDLENFEAKSNAAVQFRDFNFIIKNVGIGQASTNFLRPLGGDALAVVGLGFVGNSRFGHEVDNLMSAAMKSNTIFEQNVFSMTLSVTNDLPSSSSLVGSRQQLTESHHGLRLTMRMGSGGSRPRSAATRSTPS